MKLLTFLLFVSVASVTANSYSQQTKFSMSLENITVRQVFSEIEKASEFIFIYSEKSVDVGRIVNIKVEDEKVTSILDQLFKGTNNFYEIHDRQIMILAEEMRELQTMTKTENEVEQPQKKEISGTVKDNKGLALPGVTVMVKSTTLGTITDVDGNFTLAVPVTAKFLVFSFIGMETREIAIGNSNSYNVVLADAPTGLDEVVVVGYGMQRKESIVGAIVSATGEQLAKTGATTNLARSLQGQLPGVTTIQVSGEPGKEDPRVLIRGKGTWNNSSPLILVDGIERSMSDLNVSEVESVSVLKDASATAVFGVKGAEGVILITTKRGLLGKPKISINANTSAKFLSRTPKKLNAYDGFVYKNNAIEYEVSVQEDAWGSYTPMAIVNHYKQPQSEADKYIFADVNWTDEQLKDFASSSQIDLTISGGTDFAKYFGAVSYTHEGDLLNSGLDNGKGYKSRLDYDRFNFRSNLDFNITKSTVFTVNLSGYVGTQFGGNSVGQDMWRPLYQFSSAMYPARFPDGSWGYHPFLNIPNPLYLLNNRGVPKYIRTQVTTDFVFKQNLDFITQGLSVRGSLSYDNRFYTSGGLSDANNAPQKFIDPKIIDMLPGETIEDYTYGSMTLKGINDYDWVMQPVNYLSENSTSLESAYRRLFYQAQINYSRKFRKHDVGATAIVNREEYAQGSMFPRYREDWVGRLTYNYDGKYLIETNGAYNGSEKFAAKYRFGFFPSMAIGWMISNESFLKKDWLDKLKLRYSIGKVGNDNFNYSRWGYETNWATDGTDRLVSGSDFSTTPYTQYKMASIGNPNLQWEESVKQNAGLELALFKNRINLNVDVYRDDRDKIFMSNSQRKIPSYFGAPAVAANLGKTESQGYEIELKYQSSHEKPFNYWFGWTFTHAKDKVIYAEDPVLLSNYLKTAGYQIGQTRSWFQEPGYTNNWDDVYGSLSLSTGNTTKLPGDYSIVDFNGDGQMDDFDKAPYAYPEQPQNTYTFSLGAEYKGFSIMAQFYGVYNVSRLYGWFMYPFTDVYKGVVFENNVDSWRPDNTDATWPGQRMVSKGAEGTRYLTDGSFLRLKNAEIAYTITGNLIKKLGVSSTRIYINGNNLLYFSKMMDDREVNSGISNGASYPMYRTVTLGLNVNF